MYAKIRKSMFEGTLAGTGETWAVFVFLLVHSDAEGFVDVHPRTIALLTGFDEGRVVKALAELESADFSSRSPEAQGARIVRVDDHRAWGWHITNYAKYRKAKDMQTVREQTSARVRKHREKMAGAQRDVTLGNADVTLGNALKRQEEVEVEGSKTTPRSAKPRSRVGTDDFSGMTLPEEVPVGVWREWCQFRSGLKKGTWTRRAAELSVRELVELAGKGHDPRLVVERSILNGWRGLFPLESRNGTAEAADGW